MRGGHQYDVRPGLLERVDLDPRLQHRYADHLETGRGRHLTQLVVRRVLDREPTVALFREDLQQQPRSLGEPVADQHVLGPGRRTADPIQVVGQRVPEFECAAAVEVGEAAMRCLVQHLPDRPQPGGAGKLRDVRLAVLEVDPRRPDHRRRDRRRLDHGDIGDLGVAAGPAHQIALRNELLVRLDHHSAGQPEILGERPGRRHHGVGAHQALPDPLPDRLLQLLVQRHAGIPPKLDQQLGGAGTGPVSAHATGPYRSTAALSG